MIIQSLLLVDSESGGTNMNTKLEYPHLFLIEFVDYHHKPVYVTRLNLWTEHGQPDPITGRPCWSIKLEQRFTEEEAEYFIGVAPSGANLRIFNDS